MSIEWPLVFFSIFTGIGCGMFFSLAYLAEYRGRALGQRVKVSVLSLACFAVGGGCATLHLGHPERMFGALGHPTSGIFMESAVMFLLGAIVFVYLLAIRRGAAAGTTRLLGTAGMILSAAMAFINGDTFVMAARPAWNTLLLPTFYVASAGALGAFALHALLGAAEDREALRGLLGRMLALQALVFVLYMAMVGMAPYPDESRSLGRIFAGDLAPLAWGGVLLVGMGIPAKLVKDGSIGRAATAGFLCVLAGGFAFRILMFLIGSSVRNFFG